MRFLADMGIARSVVLWLRDQGHDAVHLLDQGLEKMSDRSHFDKAAAENRIVLTFDLDFGEIVALSAGRTTSVVPFRLQNARREHVVARLRRCLDDTESALLAGAIVIVEESRLRIRHLPVGT
jgi:predicted nuclease of predicted toxin-antitoxin system